MGKLGKIVRWFVDFVEIYLPVIVFVMLFVAFLSNVFFRYVLRNPQNWTFELSVNAFVVVGLLGACAAYRKEDHVIFDLFYTQLGSKGQNILRMISGITVIIMFSIAIPGIVGYLVKLPVKTSIMEIPQNIIFSVFPILLISTVLRSIYRLALDMRSFIKRSYIQEYNTSEKDELI